MKIMMMKKNNNTKLGLLLLTICLMFCVLLGANTIDVNANSLENNMLPNIDNSSRLLFIVANKESYQSVSDWFNDWQNCEYSDFHYEHLVDIRLASETDEMLLKSYLAVALPYNRRIHNSLNIQSVFGNGTYIYFYGSLTINDYKIATGLKDFSLEINTNHTKDETLSVVRQNFEYEYRANEIFNIIGFNNNALLSRVSSDNDAAYLFTILQNFEKMVRSYYRNSGSSNSNSSATPIGVGFGFTYTWRSRSFPNQFYTIEMDYTLFHNQTTQIPGINFFGISTRVWVRRSSGGVIDSVQIGYALPNANDNLLETSPGSQNNASTVGFSVGLAGPTISGTFSLNGAPRLTRTENFTHNTVEWHLRPRVILPQNLLGEVFHSAASWATNSNSAAIDIRFQANASYSRYFPPSPSGWSPTIPIRFSQIFAGQGTEANPFQIGTAAQLRLLSSLANSGINHYSNAHFRLTADINITGTRWTPILYFSGFFDGGGFSISGMDIRHGYLHISHDMHIGLFGYVSGTISNLTVRNSSITVGNVNTGNGWLRAGIIAGAVGYHGVINYVVSEYNTVTVHRYRSSAGGLAGISSGLIQTSQLRGSTIIAHGEAGGIAGAMFRGGLWNNLIAAHSSQQFRGTVIRYYFNRENRSIGGIVGSHHSGVISRNGVDRLSLERGNNTGSPNFGIMIGWSQRGDMSQLAGNWSYGVRLDNQLLRATIGRIG